MFKNFIKGLLPFFIYDKIQKNRLLLEDFRKDSISTIKNINVIKGNKKFRNMYLNNRCFILCNGPSINNQKIEMLKDEIVFGVSTGYLHDKYKIIHPKFHCLPQFTYNDAGLNKAYYAQNYLKKMEKNVYPDTEIFFNISEKRLIEENGLFKNYKINYVYFGKSFDNIKKPYLIDKVIPSVQSVPIMCIMIAIYMGFNKIYLIGTEHDAGISTDKYIHAYKNEINERDSGSIGKDNKIILKKLECFRMNVRLFQQYRYLHYIAEQNGIKIYNATAGGILDEFPRVEFEKILKNKE